MTGWSTITAVPYDYDERSKTGVDYEETDHFGPEGLLQDCFGDYEQVRWTATAETGRGVMARLGGYRDWYEDEAILNECAYLIKYAAVVQANDTSDTGVARLYQWDLDGELVATDEYVEKELRDGRQVGERAASYIHFHYGVPAFSRQNRHYSHSVEKAWEDS